jgi:lipid II:glycine glycyltransferase (peptidoglycan interpeptide bridge formation enzyme)
MSYITIDLEDYFYEIVQMIIKNKSLREELLDAIREEESNKKQEGYLASNSMKHSKDETNINLNKLIDNYWKLTVEEDDLIRKMADRF